jgi:hypothetical protein
VNKSGIAVNVRYTGDPQVGQKLRVFILPLSPTMSQWVAHLVPPAVEVSGPRTVRGYRWPRRFCPPEISFNQGAEWKALISKYIGTIPLSDDASCAAEQSPSAALPSTAVSSAMTAKVGAAARHSQSAAPAAARR